LTSFSRWLTQLFQSNHDQLARLRDSAFLPSATLPWVRGHMLRVLTGTQCGWWGRYPLEAAFIDALDAATARGGCSRSE
ncbi:MAG TPA: hypothetical protein PK789_08970, partial [Thermomonas sp.]|nr:hypothetical protein [Thermomonas sp.]